MSTPGIYTRTLEKRYRRTPALRGVDLEIPEGGVALLVGPNGAGKTSLLKIFMDLIPFEGGEVRILGMDPRSEGERIRAAAGFLPEAIQFPFDGMKVRQILDLNSRFRPGWDPSYADELVRTLELRMDQPWKKLSKGESRRVQLACALAHRPPLLLLDEPTDGLDPLARERILGLLAEHLAETGATTLYCTHVLHEAQGLADRLIVLNRGVVHLDESAETLRRTHHRIRFPLRDAPLPPASMVVRTESQGAGDWQGVVRGEAAEVRRWADDVGVALTELTPIHLGDAALAYLAHAESGGAGTPTSASTATSTPNLENSHA